MLRRGGTRVRPVRAHTVDVAIQHALRDPVTNALPGARLQELRGSTALSQEFSLAGPDEDPSGVIWHGVNISPMTADEHSLDLFARAVVSGPRRASSLVGGRVAIERLWRELASSWGGSVREYRWCQPLLVARDVPARTTDQVCLRRARPDDARIVYPSAVAMFREEVGTDPTAHDGGRAYRSRVRSLIRGGRTYIIEQDDEILFKADVGAIFGPVAQVHGVWVPPEHRGKGIARRAMQELVGHARRDHGVQISLYVNDYNEPARRAYAAAGYEQVGELATIMF